MAANARCQTAAESDVSENWTPPAAWSTKRKAFIVIAGIAVVINSTLGSALPSGASSFMADDFRISNAQQLTLPMTCYLIGYILGPVVFGPLSETYGRRPVMLSTFAGYTIFTMACALAPNFAALVVFRLLTGIFASAPTAVVGGLYADIFPGPKARGRSMAGFMAATTLGPTLGPVISGYLSVHGWRWTYWASLIIAGATWPLLVFLPETYVLVLRQQASRTELAEGVTSSNGIAAAEINAGRSARQLITRVLTRPLRMLYSESIVMFSCIYLSLIYSIFYLFFEAYPIVFQGVYGMTPGQSGLAFIPIAVGALLSFVIYLAYDNIFQRAQASGKAWTSVEEYRRLPLACLGGPLYTASVFMLAWTARRSVHWIVPMLAGLPFGIGFLLIFMALINYLTDAYGAFAASALAAASCTRSVSGALLPLAADPMYASLGIQWATSLLAFLSAGMILIPFGFIWGGEHLRANSKFSRSLNMVKNGDK